MIKNPIYLSSLILIIFSFAACQDNAETISFPLDIGERPESITKGFNENYFVTVMNGKEDGDGEVVMISEKGVRSFFKGANEPKGIVFLKDHLYFSDVNRIWKVDKNGKGEVFVDQDDFPRGVLYLNDVSLDGRDKGIYVANMGDTKNMRDGNGKLWSLDSENGKEIPNTGHIYHIDLSGNIRLAQGPSSLMPHPNGVGIDNKGNLMIGAFFTGNFLVNRKGKLTPLKGTFRGADAVEQDKDGFYYVSSWEQGKVWKIDGVTEQASILVEGLQSAADFYLEEDKERLLLPDMKAGKVFAVPIN